MSGWRGYGAQKRRLQRATAASKARMAAITPTEHQEQVAFFEQIGANLARMPDLEYVRAIPNQRANVIEAVKYHAEGARAGTLDVVYPRPLGSYTGLWIEFKAGNGRWSKDQIAFGRAMLAWGWCVVEARSAEQGWLKLMRYRALAPALPGAAIQVAGLEPPPALLEVPDATD